MEPVFRFIVLFQSDRELIEKIGFRLGELRFVYQCTDRCTGTKQLFTQHILTALYLKPSAEFDDSKSESVALSFQRIVVIHSSFPIIVRKAALLVAHFSLLITISSMETMLEISQLAVPISAPSHPGTASTSATFAGLTLPP